jgi:hypothetical protein
MLKARETVVQHGFETPVGLNGKENVKVLNIYRGKGKGKAVPLQA